MKTTMEAMVNAVPEGRGPDLCAGPVRKRAAGQQICRRFFVWL
jgi:hypothetical protein